MALLWLHQLGRVFTFEGFWIFILAFNFTANTLHCNVLLLKAEMCWKEGVWECVDVLLLKAVVCWKEGVWECVDLSNGVRGSAYAYPVFLLKTSLKKGLHLAAVMCKSQGVFQLVTNWPITHQIIIKVINYTCSFWQPVHNTYYPSLSFMCVAFYITYSRCFEKVYTSFTLHGT